MDCVFCKIVKGEIPCYKIYEDDDVLAMLDIAADVEGHTLVLPKVHAADINECDAQTYQKVMLASKKIVDHFLKLGYDGANVVVNCKRAAGQEVPHLNVHVFPRKDNDGVKIKVEHPQNKLNLEDIAKKLRLN